MSAEQKGWGEEPITDPELLNDFIHGVHNLWNRLPEEHQANAAFQLVEKALKGNWGEWLRQSLAAHLSAEPEPQGQQYFVTSFSRATLPHVEFSEEEIAMLDDSDLKRIAQKMEDYYITGEFWGDLEFATSQVLNEKKEGI